MNRNLWLLLWGGCAFLAVSISINSRRLYRETQSVQVPLVIRYTGGLSEACYELSEAFGQTYPLVVVSLEPVYDELGRVRGDVLLSEDGQSLTYQLLLAGARQEHANAWIRSLLSEEGRAIMSGYGYIECVPMKVLDIDSKEPDSRGTD